jgi:5-formyltetrahydrofolate cyclo-ligase
MEPTQDASWEEIRHWRKQKREELLARRTSLSVEARHEIAERARALLVDAVDLNAYKVLGFCWPIKAEIDVHRIAQQHIALGGEVALPVILQKSAPVEFWRWYPGIAMQTGIWNIPIPTQRDVLILDAVIVPLVGFDAQGFRLGYGGGYFDRTLAAAARRPLAIGLGYADSALPTIYPQPHDIPMNMIVTDKSVHRIGPTSLT